MDSASLLTNGVFELVSANPDKTKKKSIVNPEEGAGESSTGLACSCLLLSSHQWIHNFPLTHILKDNILHGSNISSEWLSHLKSLSNCDLNELPFLEDSSLEKHPSWPASLHTFLSKAYHSSLNRTQSVSHGQTTVDVNMAKGMNPKKQHEVGYMASLIADVIQESECNMVVDVGSGLGYLDHVLHQVYGYPVLGLEVSHSHQCGAEARAVKQGLQCGGVESSEFLVSDTEECHTLFESLLRVAGARFSRQCGHSLLEEAPSCSSDDVRVCLVGLHSCGDLSVAMMSLFNAVPAVRAMVGVACCYHKMAHKDGQFDKFPLSAACKDAMTQVKAETPDFVLSPFTFRLGAQETRLRWAQQTPEDHTHHCHQVFYRALLELTDLSRDLIHKSVRKCDFSSVDSFLDTFIVNAHLGEGEAETFRTTVSALYGKHEKDIDLIEPFTCLQVVLQPVIESLIYKDRLMWLRERGHKSAKVIPIFDEAISPRNLALVVAKS